MNQKIKWNIYLITSAIAILGLAMLSCMGGIKATTVSGEVSYKSFEESGMTAVEYNAACPFFAPPVCTPTTNTFCVDGLTNAWKYDCELRRGADFLRADPEFTEARLEAEAISVGDEIVEEDGESVQSSQSLDLENSGQESESLSEEERTARLNEAIGWLKVEAESAERDEAQIKKAFAQIQAFKAVLDLKDKEERDAIEAAFDYAMSIFRGEGNSRDGQYNGTQASSGSSSGGQISGVTNAGLGSVAAGQAAQTLEGLTIMTVGCCDGRTINEILGWSSKTGFNVHELKTIAGELPAGWQDLIVKAEPDLIISLMHGELEAGCPGCGGRTLAGGVSSGSSVLDDWVLISKIDPSAWKQSMKVADQLDGFWYVTENNVSILSGLTSNSAQGVYPTGALVNGRWQYLSEAEFNAVLLGEANPLLSRGVLTSEMRAVMNANAVAIEAGGATATELALGTGQGMNRLVFNFTTRPPYELSDDIYNAFYVEGVGVADSYFGITTHLDDIGNSLKQAIYPLSHAPAHMDIYLIGTQAEVDALWFELQNWGKFQDLILNNFSHTRFVK